MSRPPQISPAVEAFIDLVAARLAPALADFGFVADPPEPVDPHIATCAFRNGSRYVEAVVNLHPRDMPHYCNVVLGEGGRAWPEADWNTLALWRMIRAQPGGSAAASEYVIRSADELPDTVERMRTDLLSHAVGFLKGDVETFRTLRAEVNRSREPYKIHHPAEQSGYVAETDPVSEALKERFSK
jgi:hypothetical protein